MPSLLRGFVESVELYADRPALRLGDDTYSYAALGERAASIADTIEAIAPTDHRLAGVFADRSLTAYAGIAGILAAGRGYVPIHPQFPFERIVDVIDRSGIDVLVVGRESLEMLNPLLDRSRRTLAIIAPEFEDLRLWARRHRRHRFVSQDAMQNHSPPLQPPDVAGDDPAYLLFTSGSTGDPKGVAVSHRNARAYIDYICHIYGLGPDDRVSQTFKLAFDLSVHDLFSTWSSGGCLCPLTRRDRMAPGRFIRHHELTRWFSVPTMGMAMQRFGQLREEAFPSLKTSLFCGEPLPASLCEDWQKAAPNSTIENLYGPTEATIAITSYRWRGSESRPRCRNGVVPIGRAFPGQQAMVVDDQLQPVEPRQRGELVLSGSQVTGGYWQNPELTDEQWVRIDGADDRRWYRTGDIVEADETGCLHFLGRIDDQVQIQGHRVELAEVDYALRRCIGHDMAVSVAWPDDADTPTRLVGFIADDDPIDEAELLEKCRRLLPDYMVPSRLAMVDRFPRNTSGKIDRNALCDMLDTGEV